MSYSRSQPLAPSDVRQQPNSLAIRLRLDELEDRIAPATFTVTNNGDTGTGSGSGGDLRYCIAQANAVPGPNTISYGTGISGTAVTSDLPGIVNDLTLQGPANLNLGGTTLTVNAGVTLTASAFTVGGGTLDGGGTVVTEAATGARFANVISQPSLTIESDSGVDLFRNFTDNGPFNIAPNTNATIPVSLDGFFTGTPGQSTAAITVGANSHINVNNFLSNGSLTLVPGAGGATQLTITGSVDLAGRTLIADVADVANQNAGIDVSGNTTKVGGLFVNNGYVIDSSNGGAGTHGVTIWNYGALVEGAGFFQNTVVTGDGQGDALGLFQPGNGPGSATFGSFHFSGPTGNTGVSDLQWQLNDAGPSATYPTATGVAGPIPNAAGQVSGWGLIKVGTTLYSPGNFYFDATSTDKLTVNLQSLAAANDMTGAPSASGTYSTVSTGLDTSGAPPEFDPTKSYTWPVVTYQGTYTGPTNPAILNASTIFNTGQFAGVQPGTFGWLLAPGSGSGGQLDLVYTPPPPANNPPAAPDTPTAVANSQTSITVAWNAVTGADNYQLVWAASPTGPWTQVYYASGTSFTDDNFQFSHIGANSTNYYRVAATNSDGSSPYSGTAAVTTPPYPVTTVVSVVVNDGSAQRSEVRSISVTFSSTVLFTGGIPGAAAAFELTRVQTGADVSLSAAVSYDGQGRPVVTLTFTGSETDLLSAANGGAPSLADGQYSLTIFANQVTNLNNQKLDGDGDGAPGGNYVSPADTLGGGPGQLHLYRLFGDTTGDGVDDQQDLGQFRGAFNVSAGNAAYLSYLDADNSGNIDQVDLSQFRGRFNSSVF